MPNERDRPVTGVFVGREKEMEALRAGLEDALSGRGRLMLLVGEPGIGKTRTAEELASFASLRVSFGPVASLPRPARHHQAMVRGRSWVLQRYRSATLANAPSLSAASREKGRSGFV